MNVTLFGNRLFANIIKMRSYWSRVSPIILHIGVALPDSSTVCVLVRRGDPDPDPDPDPEGRLPCENGDRDWSYAAAAKEGLGLLESRDKEGSFSRGFGGSMALTTP